MARLVRRPALVDIPAVWGEPLSITVHLTDAADDVTPVAASAVTAVITSPDGVTTKASTTGTLVSTGVFGVNFTDSQLTNDVGPGRWMYAVTATIDGSEQTVVSGMLDLNRPAVSGVAQ